MHVCACVFYIQITRQIITFANFLSAKINHISSSKGKYQLKVSFIKYFLLYRKYLLRNLDGFNVKDVRRTSICWNISNVK